MDQLQDRNDIHRGILHLISHVDVNIRRPAPHSCPLYPLAKASHAMVGLSPSQLYRRLRSNLWLLAFCFMMPSTLAQSITLGPANVLIYSATKGYRHDSIPTAIQSLKSLSTTYNITFDDTEDLTWFREDRLGKYDAVVFLSTTGEGESFEWHLPLMCNLDRSPVQFSTRRARLPSRITSTKGEISSRSTLQVIR